MDRRIFSGTLHFERWRGAHSDDAGRSPELRTALFISDKQWAHNVIEFSGLSKSSDGHEVVIFHINPGNGVLIESLLDSCDHKQIAWEPRKVFQDYLKSLAELYETKFAYCSRSFANDGQLKTFDKLISNNGTTDDARYHAKIVGNVPEMYSFIPKLAVSLGGFSNFRLCQFGIIEPILIVSGTEYRMMTEAEHFWQKSRHARTSVYELFLRTELLKTVPLSAFNHAKHFLLKSTTFDYDRENFYVVRLSLRKDIDSVCSREEIVGIILLLGIINNKKAQRVIPQMEHLCPDIGLTLLELGISMMDRFCDIPLNMWPEIYRAVTTSRQFSCSALYHIFQRKGQTFGIILQSYQ